MYEVSNLNNGILLYDRFSLGTLRVSFFFIYKIKKQYKKANLQQIFHLPYLKEKHCFQHFLQFLHSSAFDNYNKYTSRSNEIE